jgi:hypothetical protein
MNAAENEWIDGVGTLASSLERIELEKETHCRASAFIGG